MESLRTPVILVVGCVAVIKSNLDSFEGVLSRRYDEIKTCLIWLQVSVSRRAHASTRQDAANE